MAPRTFSSYTTTPFPRWLKVEGPKKIDHNYIHFIAHLWQLDFSCEICYIDSMVKNNLHYL